MGYLFFRHTADSVDQLIKDQTTDDITSDPLDRS